MRSRRLALLAASLTSFGSGMLWANIAKPQKPSHTHLVWSQCYVIQCIPMRSKCNYNVIWFYDRSADMSTGLHISPCAVKPAKKCWRISKKPGLTAILPRCAAPVTPRLPKAASVCCAEWNLKSFTLCIPAWTSINYEKGLLFFGWHTTQNPGRSSTVDPWPRTQVEHRWNVYTERWKASILAQCGCILHVSARIQSYSYFAFFGRLLRLLRLFDFCFVRFCETNRELAWSPAALQIDGCRRSSDTSRAVYAPRCSESECKWSVNLSACTMFY